MNRRPGRADVEWETPQTPFNWEHVAVEVLMDIRSELRKIRRLAECSRIPRGLDAAVRIDRRLAKRIKLP